MPTLYFLSTTFRNKIVSGYAMWLHSTQTNISKTISKLIMDADGSSNHLIWLIA